MFVPYPLVNSRPIKEVPSINDMGNMINPFLDHLKGDIQRSPQFGSEQADPAWDFLGKSEPAPAFKILPQSLHCECCPFFQKQQLESSKEAQIAVVQNISGNTWNS
jgi:hypothetical protein